MTGGGSPTSFTYVAISNSNDLRTGDVKVVLSDQQDAHDLFSPTVRCSVLSSSRHGAFFFFLLFGRSLLISRTEQTHPLPPHLCRPWAGVSCEAAPCVYLTIPLGSLSLEFAYLSLPFSIGEREGIRACLFATSRNQPAAALFCASTASQGCLRFSSIARVLPRA